MEEPQATGDVLQIAFKKRTAKGKTNLRKRPAIPPPASDSDSGFTSSEDEGGHRIKRRRTKGAVTASSKTTGPRRTEESTATSTNTNVPTVLNNRDDATKTSNWFEEKDSKNTQRTQPSAPDAPTNSDGVYRGTANYSSFIQKNPDSLSNKTVGPVKGSSNVRTITLIDYAPDVCKDYKQTGYCGFGDNCKFLHDRSDYKQGWQLDRDWEIDEKKNGKKTGKTVASANRGLAADDPDRDLVAEEEALLESIPFACIICKGDYKSPVVTKCGHYFCEGCALQRYRKRPDCAACGAGTGGVFNVAKKLKSLLERKTKRQEEREVEAEEKE